MPEVLHLVGETFDTLSKFDTVFMHSQCIKIQLASCRSSADHPSNNIIIMSVHHKGLGMAMLAT